jgi:DNA-directed RNA polymerase subunit RPC12/RpoP
MPKEVRSEETTLYQCVECGQTILARLPSGLKGEFAHGRCRRVSADYAILDAEIID